ncbi:PAS domain-containing protein [Hymenobacter sp. GOD-10R]|uniref:PAS domain-containing protein n=1 Tax=Hymenobacter sp. GOD-10R TaxID=3093922 RepID=UPI002D7716E4|nr:PAS domain-containing protein [Hymenobacter sp. GOD-10R]WRQ27662.1 PAS domain-containing protein [Hymenobacter sp. GOD-10R]
MNAEAASVEYFDLFRSLPDKYLLLSPTGTVLALNDAHAASSLPQRRQEDVIGLDFFDVWPPNSDTEGDIVRQSHQQVRDTHAPAPMPLIRYDLPLPTGGYEPRYWQATHFPVLSATGELRYILQKTEDVTEKHLAELRNQQMQRELAETHERARFILESVPAMVWTATPDGQRDYFNARWLDFTGLPLAEQVGEQWFDSLHPDDRAPVRQRWAEAIATTSVYQVEYRLRRADGQYRWVLMRGVPHLNEQGQVTMWVGGGTDIQEQKQLVQELLETNEQQAALSDQAYQAYQEAEGQRDALRMLFAEAPAMFAVFRGPEHRFEFGNQRYLALFEGRHAKGIPVAQAIPEAIEQGYVELLDSVYQTGQPISGNEALLQLPGAAGEDPRRVYLNFSYQPFRENGQVAGVTAFAYDVTDLVHARQALEQRRHDVA